MIGNIIYSSDSPYRGVQTETEREFDRSYPFPPDHSAPYFFIQRQNVPCSSPFLSLSSSSGSDYDVYDNFSFETKDTQEGSENGLAAGRITHPPVCSEAINEIYHGAGVSATAQLNSTTLGAIERGFSEPNARSLREELNGIKLKLETEPTSVRLLKQYIAKHLELLEREFLFPEEVASEGAKNRWQKLSQVLKNEKFPATLDALEISGCGPIYYATALVAFLKSRSAPDLFGVGEGSGLGSVVKNVDQRLQQLLGSFLKISALIDALKLLPSPETEDLPSLIEKTIGSDLLYELSSGSELLVPLGWLLHKPLEGHLILAKLKCPKEHESLKTPVEHHVKLFNPNPSYDDLLNATYKIGNTIYSIYRKNSAFSFKREAKSKKILKDVYTILPLQVPKYVVGKLSVSGGSKLESGREFVDTATKLNYAVLGQGGIPQNAVWESPLDSFQYNSGKNCVPTAFRMLLYTLAKEEAEKDEIDFQSHCSLKEACDDFLERFRIYVAGRLLDVDSDSEVIKRGKIFDSPEKSRAENHRKNELKTNVECVFYR